MPGTGNLGRLNLPEPKKKGKPVAYFLLILKFESFAKILFIPEKGITKIKWTKVLKPKSMATAIKNEFIPGTRFLRIQGPAPNKIADPNKRIRTSPSGSQARLSELDGNMVLLMTNVR